MMIGNVPKLGTALLILGMYGCASCPVEPDFGSVPRPNLIPMSAEIWSQIPPEGQDIITVNDLALKETIKRWEARARIHDEPL